MPFLPKALLVPAALILLLAALDGAAQTAKDVTQVEMRNISYHYTDGIAVQIQQLAGKLHPTKPGRIPAFDDTTSFDIEVSSAQVFVTVDSMAHVLNDYVLAGKDAPIRDVSIQTRGNSLVVKGRKGAMPFEAAATLSVNPDGEIVLHTEKVRVAHLPVKGLMDFLGLEMTDMINTKKIQGVRADGDNLILNPEKVLPPPHIQGKISSVSIQGNNIVETIGGPERVALMAGNYMAYHGGSITFGKLTMIDADLTLIDMDSKDPFDFYFQRYKEQLTAGYSKTTNSFALRVYMRDFNKLPGKRPAR